jgi:hypothetical protein
MSKLKNTKYLTRISKMLISNIILIPISAWKDFLEFKNIILEIKLSNEKINNLMKTRIPQQMSEFLSLGNFKKLIV